MSYLVISGGFFRVAHGGTSPVIGHRHTKVPVTARLTNGKYSKGKKNKKEKSSLISPAIQPKFFIHWPESQ
jgi:hypothetical protein